MTCGNQAKIIVVIGGPGRIKDSAAANKLAALAGEYGRYGYGGSRRCCGKRAGR